MVSPIYVQLVSDHGDIINEATQYTAPGAYGPMQQYVPGYIYGGTGAGHEGYGLFAQGRKFINDASVIHSLGSNYLRGGAGASAAERLPAKAELISVEKESAAVQDSYPSRQPLGTKDICKRLNAKPQPFSAITPKGKASTLERSTPARQGGKEIDNISIPRSKVTKGQKTGSTHKIGGKGERLFLNQFPEHAMDRPNIIPNNNLMNINGTFNYVVTENNTLIVGRKADLTGGGHIDLASGKPVIAAGEVKVVNGQIKYIDNSSGHYLPTGIHAREAAENAFKQLGFEIQGKYIEKEWVDIPKLPKGGAWRPK